MAKLREALDQARTVRKHVDEPVAGTYRVSKANFDPGYYEDFQPDDPERRLDIDTSSYWTRNFPGDEDPLEKIASFAGDDDWTPGHSWTSGNRGGAA